MSRLNETCPGDEQVPRNRIVILSGISDPVHRQCGDDIDADRDGGIMGTAAFVASWVNLWQVLGAWSRYFCINDIVEPYAPLPPHKILVSCICYFVFKAHDQHRLHSSVVRLGKSYKQRIHAAAVPRRLALICLAA